MTERFGLPERIRVWEVRDVRVGKAPIVVRYDKGTLVVYGPYVVVSTPGEELTQGEIGQVTLWFAPRVPSTLANPILFMSEGLE